MYTSLSSALSLHGARPIGASTATQRDGQNAVSPASSATKSRPPSTTARTKTNSSIRALTIHPSLPRLAYLTEETLSEVTSSTHGNKSKGSSSDKLPSTSVKTTRQQLIIQQFNRMYADGAAINFGNNCNNHENDVAKFASYDQQNVLAALSMEKIPPPLNKFRQSKSKSSKLSSAPLTLATMGPLQSITFLDRDALFWETRRKYGYMGNMDHSDCSSLVFQNDGPVMHEDVAFGEGRGGMGCGLCLGLQFTRVLVVLRFLSHCNRCSDSDSFEILCCLEGQRNSTNSSTNLQSSRESTVLYTPTSPILPISDSIFVYGCSDGAMRFHSLLPSMLYSSKVESLSNFSFSSSFGTSAGTMMKSAKQTRQATIKSVRGPNGRNDPVVKIVNVDPAAWENNDSGTFGVGSHDGAGARVAFGEENLGGDATKVSDDTTLVLRSRLVTVCASGVAYVWDVTLEVDRASGSVKDLTVQPPLVRIDGLGSMTVSPRKSPPTFSSGGFWSGVGNVAATTATSSSSKMSSSKESLDMSKAPFNDVPPAISYDPQRNLLVWTLPRGAPSDCIDHRGDYKFESFPSNSPQAKRDQEDKVHFITWASDNGGFVKAWDFSLVDALVHKNAAAATSSPQPPPKFPPVAVMKLPSTPTSFSSTSVHVTAVAGLSHSSIPATTLACVSLSDDYTEVHIHAMPLPSLVVNADELSRPPSASSAHLGGMKSPKNNSSTNPTKILYAKSIKYHAVPFASAVRKSYRIANGNLKGSCVSSSALWPDTLAIATDQGVVMINLAEGDSWASKVDGSLLTCSRKVISQSRRENEEDMTTTSIPFVPVGPFQTIISGGPVGGVGNRSGVLFVEGNAVYASRLGTSRSSSHERRHFYLEKVDLLDPVLLCRLPYRKLPWTTIRTTPVSTFIESTKPIKLPPRLIPSPSGKYVCLFWQRDKKYEILHAASLLVREQGNGFASTPLDSLHQGVSPSVDDGRHILSFAWVGDEDQFAILKEPRSSSNADRSLSSPKRHMISSTPDGLKDSMKSLFTTSENDVNDTVEYPDNDAATSSSDALNRPTVELKKIAEAEIDAVELAAGASIAAATTVSLGYITVRGSDRASPIALFGGPALCIGCLPLADKSSHFKSRREDGVAYFYSRRMLAINENDTRASAYSTIGPCIPYPDLVCWDDSGKLCVVALGLRVALYLSDNPKFTLLGSVNVMGPIKRGEHSRLISLKFIHNVLYCSTPSSVHCIFLGNIMNNETVCELDEFTIASNAVPIKGLDNPAYSMPVPIIASLSRPHILSYHSGGLLVSTSSGLRLLPMSHPILRIGTLLAANLAEKARKWISASPKSEHDAIAHFLFRRGWTDLAINELSGLSMESYIDLCIQLDRFEELETLFNDNGTTLIHEICDWGRGDITGGYSAFFCICVYFLSRGKVECARKLTREAFSSEIDELRVDAMKLAAVIAVLDKNEGKILLEGIMDSMKEVSLVSTS
ncbi:hypothetical protein ACHAXS_009923 [Conticribra weissflogii]